VNIVILEFLSGHKAR